MGGVQTEAEDALSRAMLKAFEKLPVYAAEILNLRAWLTTFTYNLCMDIHRERANRETAFEYIDDAGKIDHLTSGTAVESPEDIFSDYEQNKRLRNAVESLPARLREPFILRIFHEMEYAAIAEQLNLTPANVRKRIQQAREFLKEKLCGTN